MVTDSHKINVKKVKTELQELIALLKNRLPFGVYSKLLKETNNFTDNQKSLELINLLCEKENIDLNNNFKEIVKLSNLNINNKNFNPIELVQEERRLITEIRKALSYNNEEYEITFVSDFNSYFQNYLEYKLTDADWKYFDNYYEQFRQIYSKYAIVDRINEIEQDFSEINKYYTINDQRNDIFIEKLLKNENINLINSNKERSEDDILKNSKEVIIAVTGGFHSSQLEDILSKKEVNTIIITPTIYESTKQANKKYIDLIEEQSKINSQALAYTIASCIKDSEKQKLLLAIVKDIVGNNTEALEKLLGKKINLSLSENITPLTQQEQNQLNRLNKYIETTTEILIDLLPKEGGKTVFVPNINKAILEISKNLIKAGIFLSDGPVLGAEQQGLPDLQGIPAEIYSRMHRIIQESLLKTSVLNSQKTKDNPPQLTMTFLKKILDKTPLKRTAKIKIISVIEAPIIMLGLIFPSLNNWFLRQHKVKDIEDKIMIASELETLDDNIKNEYFSSFVKIKETLKIPFVRIIVAFSISTVKAFKANIQGHIQFNTTAYLVQSYKYLVNFDVDYAKFFKHINLTTKQEKQIIRMVLNLKDKLSTDTRSKYYTEDEIKELLQTFMYYEILYLQKNGKLLYITSVINNLSDLERIDYLLKDLMKSDIYNVETEYNMLALKIFKSKNFRNLIDKSNIEYGSQSSSQKYFIAIAVARYINKVLSEAPINNKNLDEIIRVATETYIEILKNNENKVVVDENTKIIAISAKADKSQEFNNNGLKKLLEKLNIPENGEGRKFFNANNEDALKEKLAFLKQIENLNSNDKQVFISFDGHGSTEFLFLDDHIAISGDELFNALKKAQDNGFDLNNLTINLSSCNSWAFANSIYDNLDNLYKNQKKIKPLQTKNYPTIWTAAGHETTSGYTNKYCYLSTVLFDEDGELRSDFILNPIDVGNEWNGVLRILEKRQTSLQIKDILKATLESKNSNFTVFVSDKNIEQICNESAKKILELNGYNNVSGEKQQNIKNINSFINKIINLLTKINSLQFTFININNNINDEILNFDKGYFELSIFSKLKYKNKLFELLNKTAYIWEEIVFRLIPVSLSILAISVPMISFLTIPLSLVFFVICQNQFIKAHNVSKWITENKFNWSTADILKATLLNSFPSKELKENFKQFEKQGQIKEQARRRVLPTLLLSVPYIYSVLFAPTVSVIMLAAIIGITLHKFFNSILKDKLSVFETHINGIIDLSTSEGKQEFFSLLSDKTTNINDIVNRIDFNNEQQLLDLIQTINQHYLYLDRPLEIFITELSKRINVNNDKELDFLRNILDASIINKERIISDLIPKTDFDNPKHFDFIKHFILNKSIQTTSINSKLIDKLDLGNKDHLDLITSLSRFSDEIIFKLIDKLNFDDKEQVYTISNLIVNIGFSNTNYIMNEVLAKLNLNNQKDLTIFEKVVCNYKFRTEELFERIINMLDLSNPKHVKTVEKILNKEYFKILPVFNILLKHLNFNNVEHRKLFQTAVDKVIANINKEIVVNDIFAKTIGSLVVENKSDLNFLTYTRHQLLDALLKKLIKLRTENLEIKNGLAVIHLGNQTKIDSIKVTALKIKADIESLDNESIEKLNEILKNVELFENMQKHKTTIEDFAQQTGLSLLKPTPTTYLGNRRSIFTSLLKLLPKSLYTVNQHATTFFMSKNSIDENQLKEVSAKFDIYMKFLDENLYVLNKFNDLTEFSSQFDDVVKHINIMLDYLSVISESDANIFRRIFKELLEDIHNGTTDITTQKKVVEMVDNPFSNINTIGTLINRIHQKTSFDFLSRTASHIGKDSVIEHNIYLSKGSKTIGVYNLSKTKLHPDITRLLMALSNDPDFGTEKNSHIFIKDNILLWTGVLGAHAVRVVIDFNENSRSILADFHEGMIDEGSYIRINMLRKIFLDIGFAVEDSAQQYQKYDRLVGIVATLNKDTGLQNNSDFVDLAQKLMVLFNNAAEFNNSIKRKSQIRQTIRVSVLRIMDIYFKNFYVGRFKNNYIRSTINTRKNLNKILSLLGLPLIPKEEPGFRTNLKVGPFFAGRITTYGQNTIDQYINKPIERAFALGSIKINATGSLEKNNDYNLLPSTIETLKKLLDSPIGNPQEIELLKQGAILSQVPVRDLNLESCEQIGDYVLKTGYMKLVDGRLNDIKGDFIGFKVLVDKNGIIRYSTTELVGFPEQMNNNSGRLLLTSEQLQQLFEIEGYNINPNEPLTNQELYNYRNKLQQDVFNTGTPVAYGLTLSKPKNLTTRGVSATIGSDIYIDKYASPENVGMSAQNKVSLFTGGSYSSHAGIVLREYSKSAFIVNDSQIIKNKTNNEIKIKFYAPKGDVKTIDKFKTQEIEEIELTLELNDIVVIDHQNNKLLLFPNKIFKNSKGQNILFELQKYIDDKDTENIKNFINQYKNNSELTERIIEYIYYQSSDNSWLEDLLSPQFKNKKTVVKVSGHSRVIRRNKVVIQKFLSHKSKNNVYRFGEKESLDATKVGTKSANQSKLFLTLEQLRKDTGIENIATPTGIVIGYDILEKLFGEEYIEYRQQLEAIIKGDFYDEEEKFIYAQDPIARIKDLIQNCSEEKIEQYIGKENLEIFKNNLAIIRSSGVGEDSKEYSAAGIAESFGQIEYENISKAVKDTLLSFFSTKATEYMIKSTNIIKPAILIENWIDADKAGIMMSEDNDGHRIIQIINGQGEDIVSGRITPYSFTIDMKTGKKIDGDYTNEKTVTKENLEKLTKIMEWLEQAEGCPVDIEFLIKDNIIYIVQVRPITTLGKTEQGIPVSQQKKQSSTPTVQDDQDYERPNLLSTKAHIWEELLYRTIPSIVAMINPMIGIPLFLIMQPVFLVVHTIKHYAYDKTINFTDLLKRDVKNLSLATIALIIPYAISLSLPLLTPVATVISSKIISTAASTVTAQVIHYQYNKSVPVEKQLKTHKSQQQVSGASLRHPLTSQRDIVARMSELEKNMESMDIDVKKQSLINLIKENPLLISMILETYCRAYHKNESKYTLGELLNYIKGNSHSTKQKDKLITDFRGYFGEVYVKYNVVADIDENGHIIRLQMPLDENQAGYDLVDPKTGLKIQVKTGEESIVKEHFKKYKKYHIPVFTVSEVKQLMINNNNPNSNLVYSFNLTKDDVLAFVTDVVDVLIMLSKDKSLPANVKNLTFQKIIDICNGTTTESVLSKEQITDKIEQVQLSKKEDERENEWEKFSIFETLKERGKTIFGILDFTAPVWEELSFRTIPAIISLALIALPLSHFITIPFSICVFVLAQIQFIRAHIITDWLKTKDSGWLENTPTMNILKNAILGIFPSKELKQDYKKYSQTYQAKKHLTNLIVPTIFLSSVYILTSLLPLANPVLLATIVAIIIHSFNNANVELLETLRPINRNLKLQQTEIDNNFISFAENNGTDFISIYDLSSKVRQLKKYITPEIIPSTKYINPLHFKDWQQQQQIVANSVGFSLGLTTVSISDNNKNKINLIQPISEINNLISWERGYDYFYGNTYLDERVVPVEEYVQTIIASCIRYNKHIFFFLPNNFMDLDTKTKREFDYIQKFIQSNPDFAGYFTFVVGAYDFVNVNNASVFQKYFNEKSITKTLKKLLAFPKLFMRDSFISKICNSRTSLSIYYTLKQRLTNFIEKWQNKKSMTKNITVNYKFIKTSEIKQLIQDNQQEQDITDIYIVDDIEQLQREYGSLINTGIKVDGQSIFKIKINNMLFYGTINNVSIIQIVKAINETEQFKKDLKSLLSINGQIEIDGIIRRNENGIEINDGILEIGEMELHGKTQQQINEFIMSTLKLKKTIGIMYSQKTIIDLKKMTNTELLKAIENGRARKVITEEQYNKLQLSKEKISKLKENGIEIYVANNEIILDYMQNGISGQIIRENGKPYIYDYYTMDKTELEEITEQEGLINFEQKLLNSENLIMIDIEILKKNFQGSNPIEAFSKLGALTGKIKMTIGFGNIKLKDIENVGYNINFDNIPEINKTDIQKLIKASNKEEIINIIGQNNEFAIILINLKEENVNRFKELIIERILTKQILTDTATAIEGIELQDKNLEIMLGKMLLRQINYIDKETVKTELISERKLIKILEKLKELDNKQESKETLEQQILVNTIINLILYDGQRVKGKQIQEQTIISDISNYKVMLAAA
ncbi:MAG: hypothetical protein IKN42_03085 [Elusimicrobia bacterium]|nr:hypothetical protein [Elusimicrobiota bacterium]